MNSLRLVMLWWRGLRQSSHATSVRYMFPVVLGGFAVLTASLITAGDVSYVRLESSAKTVEAGDRFSVSVYAFAHQPVNAVDISLRFDPTSVKVLSVDRGESVITLWAEDPKIHDGQITLRGGTFRRGFIGDHLVAIIELQAVTTGQALFQVSDALLLAGDGTGATVKTGEALDSKTSVYIFDENTDPSNIAAAIGVSVITDVDGDGVVALRDISIFMASWRTKDQIYDFNGDGRMTLRDFSILLSDYFFSQ